MQSSMSSISEILDVKLSEEEAENQRHGTLGLGSLHMVVFAARGSVA